VYESELRKKFLMPRTTMWRAVKRLEREDIVEIEKVDQQNLIKLRKMEDQK
ncbi:MAG TPA: MarR family transcriptional regulator, partial [Candidatus Nitrosotalea sp.]|nr:MarR family transcriptional regulator [Candidatus Nitrosotalea sp.]